MPLNDDPQEDIAVDIRQKNVVQRWSLKRKSFSFEISKKYLKKIGVYVLTIGTGIVVAYFVSPIVNVPMAYIIVPLSTSIAGTLLATKINRLLSAISYFTPTFLLDENAEVLQKAEETIATLRSIDHAKGSDQFAEIRLQLQNNISVCQGILESSGSQHFANLFIHDIKTLMSVPYRSLSEVHIRHGREVVEKMRAELLRKAGALLKPYDQKSKEKLVTFIVQIMRRLLPPDGYSNTKRVKPIFLDGPPGIGKSRLVKELSNIFSIPLLTIDCGKTSLEEIEGMQLPSPIGLPTCRAGLFLKELTNQLHNPTGCNNLIVLLDEVDKGFEKNNDGMSEMTTKWVGFLHPFLQVDKTEWRDKGYNVPIDLSNVIVVCTANRNCFADPYITESTQASLQDRVSMIKMPNLERRAKESILQRYLMEKLCLDNTLSDFQKTLVENIMHAKIQEILEADKTAGLRDPLEALEESYYDFYDHHLKSQEGALPSALKIAHIIEEYCGYPFEHGIEIHRQQQAPELLLAFEMDRGSLSIVPSVERRIPCGSCVLL